MRITPEEAVRLGRLTTRDSAGRHFTELCTPAELDRWEALGLITIHLEVADEVADWFDDGELDHDALDAWTERSEHEPLRRRYMRAYRRRQKLWPHYRPAAGDLQSWRDRHRGCTTWDYQGWAEVCARCREVLVYGEPPRR